MVCVSYILDHLERHKAEEAGHDFKKHQKMNVKRKQNL